MPGNALAALVFGLMAAVSLGLAWQVVTARRILRAAVALMGVLVASAGFYVLLDATFLAGVQILVYVGGIVVLLVFAVMLTHNAELQEPEPAPLRRAVGALIGIGFPLTAHWALQATGLHQGAPAATPTADNTAAIGRALLDAGAQGYVLPFEVVSLLLLSALIGGITLSRKSAETSATLAQRSVKQGAIAGEEATDA